MSIQEREFSRFIKLLHDSGCLEHVILVGSWAEHLYKVMGVLEGFDPNIRTLDIDFLVKNLRKPSERIGLVPLAKEAGYLVETDRLTGTTKIMDRSGLEIEFLIGKAGAGLEMSLETNIGVTAQSLWHMGILSRNVIEVDYLGMRVSMPSPEAYAVHKMAINKERKNKQEKDALAVKGIWPYLNQEEVARIKATLTKKEKAAVEAFVEEHLS